MNFSRKISLVFILFYAIFFCQLYQVCQAKELLDGSFKSIYSGRLQDSSLQNSPQHDHSLTSLNHFNELSEYAVLGDVALAIGEVGHSSLQSDKRKSYQQIKISLPQKASKAVNDILASIDLLVLKLKEQKVDVTFFSDAINKHYRNALETLNTINPDAVDAGYDYLLKAIIHYNVGEYAKAAQTLDKCLPYFHNKAVIFYTQSLLHLVEDDILAAKRMLYKSIKADKHATSAYSLLVHILINGKQYETANLLALRGVNNDLEKNYHMPFISGLSCLENLKNSYCAIYYLKKALQNTTLSQEKAECKFLLARSYFTLGKSVEAEGWYNSSLEEIGDDIFVLNEYQNRWLELQHE